MFETSNIIPLCPVDVSSLVEWITAIPFEEWPQQNRLPDGKIRPAMVNDQKWHGFGARAEPYMRNIALRFYGPVKPDEDEDDRPYPYNPMLSVVMPGHKIPRHADRQIPEWLCRVHVPLVTNPSVCFFTAKGHSAQLHLMDVGTAYAVNVTADHWIRNDGTTPRIHFMFDVRRA